MKTATITIFFTDGTEQRITLNQVIGAFHNSENLLIVATSETELHFQNVETFYITF